MGKDYTQQFVTGSDEEKPPDRCYFNTSFDIHSMNSCRIRH